MKEERPVERLALSVKEAAEAVGVSLRTMNDRVHKPGFPSCKIDGRRFIFAAELREWLKGAGA